MMEGVGCWSFLRPGLRTAEGDAHSRRGAPAARRARPGRRRGGERSDPRSPLSFSMPLLADGQSGQTPPTRTRSGAMSSLPQWKRMVVR